MKVDKIECKDNVLSISGDYSLSENVFNTPFNDQVIHQALRRESAEKRQGTAFARSISDVKKSGKKPYAQKGSGQARAGTKKSPIWRGGGTIFGPHPRQFGFSMPKKMKRLSVLGILSEQARRKKIKILDSQWPNFSGKTKEAHNFFLQLALISNNFKGKELKNNALRKKIRNYHIILVMNSKTDNSTLIRRISSNLAFVQCLNFNRLNCETLFFADCILMDADTVQKLSDFYSTLLLSEKK